MTAHHVRIYAAHPITSYGTEYAAEMLARLRAMLPDSEIVDPEQSAWPTDEAWLNDWPDILESLAGLVVFADTDRTVGAGCVTETTDALMSWIPVAGLDSSGLRRLDGFRLLTEPARSPRRFARLILGPALDPAYIAGGAS